MAATYSFDVLPTANVNTINYQIGQLYPNPSNGSFTVELPEGVLATDIRVRSISGEIIDQLTFKEQINLNVDSGIYLIEFMDRGATLDYQRLLIH